MIAILFSSSGVRLSASAQRPQHIQAMLNEAGTCQ
jgi:hypothetical protein